MKRLFILLLLCLPPLAQAADQALEQQPASAAVRLVSAVPVLHALGLSLLKDTGIEAVYLPPRRLPVNRIPGWLSKADAGKLPSAAALLTIESVWSDLGLYPLLRKADIRVVPVDVARELAPGGAQVTLRPALDTPGYFWLDFNNLLLMTNVAARDLSRLWPDQAERIEDNRRSLQRHIQQYAIDIDELLLNADIGTLATDDERLMPLAMGLALPLVHADEADLLLSADKGQRQGRVWQLNPLARPAQGDLVAWLNAQSKGLKQALARH